jgi:hypothetical protein
MAGGTGSHLTIKSREPWSVTAKNKIPGEEKKQNLLPKAEVCSNLLDRADFVIEGLMDSAPPGLVLRYCIPLAMARRRL